MALELLQFLLHSIWYVHWIPMAVFVFLVLLDKESEISLPFSSLKKVKVTLNSVILNSIASRR